MHVESTPDTCMNRFLLYITHFFFSFLLWMFILKKTCVVLNWMTLISIYVVNMGVQKPSSIFPFLWMCAVLPLDIYQVIIKMKYLEDGPKMLAINFKPNSRMKVIMFGNYSVAGPKLYSREVNKKHKLYKI